MAAILAKYSGPRSAVFVPPFWPIAAAPGFQGIGEAVSSGLLTGPAQHSGIPAGRYNGGVWIGDEGQRKISLVNEIAVPLGRGGLMGMPCAHRTACASDCCFGKIVSQRRIRTLPTPIHPPPETLYAHPVSLSISFLRKRPVLAAALAGALILIPGHAAPAISHAFASLPKPSRRRPHDDALVVVRPAVTKPELEARCAP